MSMFYLENKLQARLTEMEKYRLMNKKTLPNWKVIEDQARQDKYPPESFEEARDFALGDRWEGRDFYLWVSTEIAIPDCDNNFLYLDFGHTGGGYNSGFESLMFIDGVPYQGVDSNHKEVRIDEAYRGKTIRVALKLWSGLEGGGEEQIQVHQFKEAFLCQLNPSIDDLYYFSDMIHKTLEQIGEGNPIRYKLSKIIDKTLSLLDWKKPGSEAFYDSFETADAFLNQEISALPKEELITVTAVGHTHIDVAWLWRLKHTREKAARSFSTVLRLMEEYPEYIFLQTQPQLYKYIKEDYPEIYSKIKERVAEGRWEVDGAMWLEADCNIPSGESLTRQILHGAKFIKEEFNQSVNYLWLPDVFGYSWALPQILEKSDIQTFMTTKISWNQFNRMPHDTFYWQGLDGSKVLTHFVTTPEPGEENSWESKWYYTYNGELEPETVLGVYEAYQEKNINNELLISYGYGDGGGGVNRDMLEKRRKIDQIPGLPELKTGTAKEYFEQLQTTFKETDEYVHTWDGELYLEYHRGTYTSQAFVKKANRKSELALRRLEILYSLLEIQNNQAYPKEELFSMWETVLRNQFHDIIPGSSIKEVYEDYREEMGQVFEKVGHLTPNLTEDTKAFKVTNFTGWQRNLLVHLPEFSTAKQFKGEDGQVLPSYTNESGSYLIVAEAPPFSSTTIQVVDVINEPVLLEKKEVTNGIENEFYKIQWAQSGQLTSLFDKQNKRQVLKGKGNVFQLFEDKPLDFDAWDIDIFYQEKYTELRASTITIHHENPVFTAVDFVYEFGESQLVQTMRVYKHTRRIDFVTNVDWHERQQLLKVMFDVAVRTTEATFDIQYGNVKRPNHWNTSWDYAKFESVAHQWVDLSQRDFGVSLLNDSKYGHDIKGSQIRLSLLKGPIYPDPTADIGKHEFTYSLLPHTDSFLEGKTVEEAWEINNSSILLPEQYELPEIKLEGGAYVAFDAIKRAEDGNGWIIRMHEYSGGNQQLNCSIEGIQWWNETNLLEKDLGAPNGQKISLSFNPFEIKTIRIGK
ncbi:alpha-mannosidase [Enterococcus sp. AZ194]|uniref:alpha-mannosidase n=1 Tax=Enterococcus sp. AZ194 TaxID=2774629 RepID=UPI003F290894